MSDTPGGKMEMGFEGTHAALIGEAGPLGGYARVSVLDSGRDTVYSSLVDFYSKYPDTAIRAAPQPPGQVHALRGSDRHQSRVDRQVEEDLRQQGMPHRHQASLHL